MVLFVAVDRENCLVVPHSERLEGVRHGFACLLAWAKLP